MIDNFLRWELPSSSFDMAKVRAFLQEAQPEGLQVTVEEGEFVELRLNGEVGCYDISVKEELLELLEVVYKLYKFDYIQLMMPDSRASAIYKLHLLQLLHLYRLTDYRNGRIGDDEINRIISDSRNALLC